jgi:Pectate lyase superfamily protein
MKELSLAVLVCATMLFCTGARAQLTRITPTGINGVINVHAYGAIGDGIADDTHAIQDALDAASGTGATVMLPPTPKNLWVISSQLTVPTKVVFQGQCGSGRGMGSADPIQGTILLWEGGDNTAVVYFHDVNRSALRCMTIENNNANLKNLTGILYDSDNKPPSSYNTFEKFYVKGAHIGFACGLTTDVPTYCVGETLSYTGTSTTGGNFFTGLTDGAGLVPAGTWVFQKNAKTTTTRQVSLPASQLPVASLSGFDTDNGTILVGPPTVAGCFEADATRIQDFGMIGSDTNGDEGIHINSANCLQGSVIEKGSFQGMHFGVHIVNSNGGLRLLSLNGAHSGQAPGQEPDTTAAFLQFDPPVVSSPDLWGIETEGNFEYSVHDTACNSFAGSPGSPTWIGNAFNLQHPATVTVLADGCETITSIGNNAGVGDMAALGTTQVISLSEVKWTAGLGQPVICSGSSSGTFSGCTGGNGFMRAGTAVTQPSNPASPVTTITEAVALPDEAIRVASTAGFVPNETMYLGSPSISTWNKGVLVTDFLAATNFVKDGCAGSAVLVPPKLPGAPSTARVPNPCLDGATVIGVAEKITSGTPNALGWSLTGATLTITSASSSDNSEVAWWRLK